LYPLMITRSDYKSIIAIRTSVCPWTFCSDCVGLY